jgi:hypothetical protein
MQDSGNVCFRSVQNILPLRLLFKNIQIIIYGTIMIIILLLINAISVHLELCVRQWASNLSMAKGHTFDFGLFLGPHLQI